MRITSALACATTIAVVGGTAFVASSSAGAASSPSHMSPSHMSSSHTSSSHTMSYTATFVDGTHQDAAPAGDSIGDRDIDLFRLSTRDGRSAGDASSDCVLVRADEQDPLAQCTSTLALADGTLVLGGVTTGTPTTTYALVGGTGRYVDAGGTVTFTPDGEVVKVTVTFISS